MAHMIIYATGFPTRSSLLISVEFCLFNGGEAAKYSATVSHHGEQCAAVARSSGDSCVLVVVVTEPWVRGQPLFQVYGAALIYDSACAEEVKSYHNYKLEALNTPNYGNGI